MLPDKKTDTVNSQFQHLFAKICLCLIHFRESSPEKKDLTWSSFIHEYIVVPSCSDFKKRKIWTIFSDTLNASNPFIFHVYADRNGETPHRATT